MGLALGLLSAFTMGINSVYNRKLKNLDYYVVMCYHGLLGCGLAILIICIEAAVTGHFRTYTAV